MSAKITDLRPNIKANTSSTPRVTYDKNTTKDEIGVMWRRHSPRGEFFSGKLAITDSFRKSLESAPVDADGHFLVDVVMFEISYENERGKKPSHRLLLSKKREF